MDYMQELRQRLSGLPKEKILDYVELQFKNLWTLQNNWMVRVEEKYGHEVSTQFDGICLGRYAEVAAWRLKKFLEIGDDVSPLEALIKQFGWTVPEPGSEGELIRVSETRVIQRNTKCTMQLARRKSGLPELPCKPALIVYSEKRVKAISPKLKVVRVCAPPDPHPDDFWCEVEIEEEA